MATFKWIFLALLLMAQVGKAQSNEGPYCNGKTTNAAGVMMYANGQASRVRGDLVYPNGVRVIQSGELVYPNNQRMNITGDTYHMSGQRLVIGGDLYYPNRQRVQIGSDCFFQTGVKMNACPAQVRFEDRADDVAVSGVIDLKNQKIVDRTFTLKQDALTISWKMEPDGNLDEIETRCDESLL